MSPERSVTHVSGMDRKDLEAPPGFEPGMEVLQTSALPLGDGALRESRPLVGRAGSEEGSWSGKRDSNPRLRPWQGRTLPLSYSRSRRTLTVPQPYSPRQDTGAGWKRRRAASRPPATTSCAGPSEDGPLHGPLYLKTALYTASRRTLAAVSGGVGLRWKPVAHSNAPNRVTLGRTSMCQW